MGREEGPKCGWTKEGEDRKSSPKDTFHRSYPTSVVLIGDCRDGDEVRRSFLPRRPRGPPLNVGEGKTEIKRILTGCVFVVSL